MEKTILDSRPLRCTIDFVYLYFHFESSEYPQRTSVKYYSVDCMRSIDCGAVSGLLLSPV